MYSSWASKSCHPKDTVLLVIPILCVLVASYLDIKRQTPSSRKCTAIKQHLSGQIFTQLNLSGGQQEKDEHGVILGSMTPDGDRKGQELDLMILVNSVQLRIVCILWFHLEQSCINAMWTVTQNKSQNQRRSFQRSVKLRILKYKKAPWHSWVLSE